VQFPYFIEIGPIKLHPHVVFESLAYFVGFRLYLRQRKRSGDHLSGGERWWAVTAAILGAALGSKLLYWLSDPAQTLSRWDDVYYLMGGKTIVGGLMGGLIAVEWTKKRLGISRRTGDLFAIPLALGIAIGRIGCFLSGLTDDTYGNATSLPWGIDFGDAINRHPTQLYEIVWLIGLAFWLTRMRKHPHREGDLFKGFMIGYFGFRLLIDYLKPGVSFAGLTMIQWVCVATLMYYARDLGYVIGLKESQ
jgi:phosphatidylglycerol---prolipoprotein diacylglyceryl transferase